jgi:hypothetical protein
MKKLSLSVLLIPAGLGVVWVVTGCGSEVRTVTTPPSQPKQGAPNFKSAIQNNPNIPDAAKKAFH